MARPVARDGAEVAQDIRVRGAVQGVGFRPTVWRLARACGLAGDVRNDGAGVLIEVEGPPEAIARFVARLQSEAPPLSRIDHIEQGPPRPPRGCAGFVIAASSAGEMHTNVIPDAAVCGECRAETLSPSERRFRYPFTNCTHCGPRFSIVTAAPYDRATTTMAPFAMCANCAREYVDPADRRFHAEPIACPACGPRVSLVRLNGTTAPVEAHGALDAVNAVASLIAEGAIVAIKGIGGFHLACDATNEAAVLRLRERKRRDKKPFALMARDLDVIRRYCVVGTDEARLLGSHEAPIVLLARVQDKETHRHGVPSPLRGGESGKRRLNGWGESPREELRITPTPNPSPQGGVEFPSDSRGGSPGSDPQGLTPRHSGQHGVRPAGSDPGYPDRLPDGIAPDLDTLGFMLPYSPLHVLIFRDISRPVVMTSGNLSDEPQVIDNDEAITKLGSIADYALLHDREIANRVDDSVVRVMAGAPRLLRRARGYAPSPIALPPGFEDAPDLLAFGGELKATFCLVKDGAAILSQHQGDLEEVTAFEDYQKNLGLYARLYDHKPTLLVADRHPEYLSRKLALERAAEQGLPLVETQHHHAHIAACLAENGQPLDAPPVLGVALDGLGFGDDGAIWGGEFLLADYRAYERLATFKPVAMIGGAQAIREPWRNTYAHLMTAMGWADFAETYGDLDLVTFLDRKPRATLDRMVAEGINAPLASSCGRLFDAVAAALGLARERAAFEGEGAMLVEAAVERDALADEDEASAYPFSIERPYGSRLANIDPVPMWRALLGDMLTKTPLPVIAARFHRGLAQAVADMAATLAAERDEGGAAPRFDTAALSGGCFQNRILLEQTAEILGERGFTVLMHAKAPANDGGLALGQAAIGAARACRAP